MSDNIKYIIASRFTPDHPFDKPTVFITPFAAASKEMRDIFSSRGYEILEDDTSYPKSLKKYFKITEELYMEYLPKISDALNRIHGTDYPKRFWELPMSSWLLHFIHAQYDRYVKLKNVRERYEAPVFIYVPSGISPAKDYRTFIEDFCTRHDTVGNYYALSAIEMGIPVMKISGKPYHCDYGRMQSKKSIFSMARWEKGLNLVVGKAYKRFLPKMTNREILMSGYVFDDKDLYLFSKNAGAECVSPYEELMNNIRNERQSVDRSLLKEVEHDGEFGKMLVNMLPVAMPEYLLEYFHAYLDEAKNWDNYKTYFGGNAFYRYILLAYISALGVLKGGKIIGCQHGSGYGICEDFPSEMIERKYCDYYITWGWDDNRYDGAKTVPLPQPNLPRVKKKSAHKRKYLYWFGNSAPAYLFRYQQYPILPSTMGLYLDNKRLFANTLIQEIREKTIYRPYPYDFGWSSDEMEIFSSFPDIEISVDGSMVEVMGKAKLIVFDHMSTGLFQALASDVPMLLFWEKELTQEREEARSYMDLLREAGILFHDANKAAEKLNVVWHDINKWWQSQEVRNALKVFGNRFALSSENWREKWIEFFNSTRIHS